MSVEISSMVDIQFSVYHYKTGDIQLLKHSNHVEKSRKIYCPCLPVDFWLDIFYGDFGNIQKTIY